MSFTYIPLRHDDESYQGTDNRRFCGFEVASSFDSMTQNHVVGPDRSISEVTAYPRNPPWSPQKSEDRQYVSRSPALPVLARLHRHALDCKQPPRRQPFPHGQSRGTISIPAHPKGKGRTNERLAPRHSGVTKQGLAMSRPSRRRKRKARRACWVNMLIVERSNVRRRECEVRESQYSTYQCTR